MAKQRVQRRAGRLALAYERLPFTISMHPYSFTVLRVPRAMMTHPRVLSEYSINQQCIRLHLSLTGKELVRHFLRRVIHVIHYVNGLGDDSKEEHFTHSLATGLLRFATVNPAAWQWLNTQLAQHVCPGSRCGRLASGFLPRRGVPMPSHAHIRGVTYRFRVISKKTADRAGIWGDCDIKGNKQVRFSQELQHAHFVVVALHEWVHGIHYEEGLTDRHTYRGFITHQSNALLEFIAANPALWEWLVAAVTMIRPRRAFRRAA